MIKSQEKRLHYLKIEHRLTRSNEWHFWMVFAFRSKFLHCKEIELNGKCYILMDVRNLYPRGSCFASAAQSSGDSPFLSRSAPFYAIIPDKWKTYQLRMAKRLRLTVIYECISNFSETRTISKANFYNDGRHWVFGPLTWRLLNCRSETRHRTVAADKTKYVLLWMRRTIVTRQLHFRCFFVLHNFGFTSNDERSVD